MAKREPVKPLREGRRKDDIVRPASESRPVRLVEHDDGRVTLGEPLYRTRDGRLVDGKHPDGRELFGDKGTKVDRVELVRLGLLQPVEKNEPPKTKGRKPEENK